MQDIKIKVVDSIMGSNKTSWAIKYMQDNPEQRFMYITPYLDEVARVRKDVPRIKEPKNVKGSKLTHIKELVKYGDSIASTHQLMDKFDLEIQRDIECGEYILILDEVADVVTSYSNIDKEFTEADMEDFLNNYVYPDEEGYLIWDEEKHPVEKYNYPSNFYKEMILCLNKNLLLVNGTIMYWELPINIFKSFKEVYILTYIFKGSLQKAYFDLYDIEYEYLTVKNKQLVPYEPTSYEIRQEIKSLIHLVDKDKLNMLGNDRYAFSSTWLKKNIKKGTLAQKKLKADTENFFKNIAQTKSSQNMWSTLGGEGEDDLVDGELPEKSRKRIKGLLKGIGYGKDKENFVSFNVRATNKYQDKRALAYLYNIFPHQTLRMYFNKKGEPKGVKLNLEAYALSFLIQWIWRSAIRRQDLPREEREIHLYLPSSRMRNILLEWLDSKENLY